MFRGVLDALLKRVTLHKKWSFPLRISSVNVIKSAINFFCSVKYHIRINFVFSDESDAGENDLDALIDEINDFGKLYLFFVGSPNYFN